MKSGVGYVEQSISYLRVMRNNGLRMRSEILIRYDLPCA